jgi:hypothetical protein
VAEGFLPSARPIIHCSAVRGLLGQGCPRKRSPHCEPDGEPAWRILLNPQRLADDLKRPRPQARRPTRAVFPRFVVSG